jgi:hypothetical protein
MGEPHRVGLKVECVRMAGVSEHRLQHLPVLVDVAGRESLRVQLAQE